MILAKDDEEEEESKNAENSDSDDEEKEESSGNWSDRALMNKFGKITAIAIGEEKRGRFIHKIRARCLLPHLL